MLEILNLKEKPDDLTTLARWHQDEWSYLNPGETLEHRVSRMQPYLNADFIPSTFIAVDNILLGSAAIIAQDMKTRPQLTPWLASVFVAPGCRRNGTGSKLVLHAMQQARNAGIKTLYLFTPDKQAFYLKLNWTIMNSEQYHGHEVTVMQTILAED